MTEQNFVYWLQGYCEICGEKPTQEQWQIIKDHLQLVFKKETSCGITLPPSTADGRQVVFPRFDLRPLC